ncbi:MAG: hypothetical protein RI986_1220, partial [Planctomycetota bacterium]
MSKSHTGIAVRMQRFLEHWGVLVAF